MKRYALLVLLIAVAVVRAQPALSTRLLHAPDLTYVGSFRLPAVAGNPPPFSGATTGLAYYAAHNSLFIDTGDQRTSEISIPTPSTNLAALPRATLLQAPADLTEGHRAQIGEGGAAPNVQGDLIGGLLVANGKLYGDVYGYFDAVPAKARRSHFVSGLTLATPGDFQGLYAVGTAPPGAVAGYMAPIPAEWQTALGGTALTGQCCGIPIIQRTSAGMAAFVITPSQIGTVSPAPATPVLYYPPATATSTGHPLGDWSNRTTPTTLYNMTTAVTGLVLPDGTRTALFAGRQELGRPCYGIATAIPALYYTGVPGTNQVYCPETADLVGTGMHCLQCTPYLFAYDLADLVKVKNGQLQPWEPRPYDRWPFVLPIPGVNLQGVVYDPAARRLYVSQAKVDQLVPGGSIFNKAPVVHVFQVTSP